MRKRQIKGPYDDPPQENPMDPWGSDRGELNRSARAYHDPSRRSPMEAMGSSMKTPRPHNMERDAYC